MGEESVKTIHPKPKIFLPQSKRPNLDQSPPSSSPPSPKAQPVVPQSKLPKLDQSPSPSTPSLPESEMPKLEQSSSSSSPQSPKPKLVLQQWELPSPKPQLVLPHGKLRLQKSSSPPPASTELQKSSTSCEKGESSDSSSSSSGSDYYQVYEEDSPSSEDQMTYEDAVNHPCVKTIKFDYDHKPPCDVELWDKYLRKIHDSQGFDVDWDCYPGPYEECLFLPCVIDITGIKCPKSINDYPTTRQEFLKMAEECLTFFNAEHDKEPEYKFYDLQHITHYPTGSYSIYLLTFRASPDTDSSIIKTFRAEYYVSLRISFNRREVTFCQLKDDHVRLSKESPCRLVCCKWKKF